MNNITENDSNIASIFGNLKELPSLNSNKELLGYFKYLRFYGLLDNNGKETLNEVNQIIIKMLQQTGISLLISTLAFSYFWKLNKRNTAGVIGLLINLSAGYFYLKNYNQINFLMLLEKDRYVPMIEKFYKEDKDPLILNQNFIVENLCDPDMIFYQQMLRAKILNKH